jgi:hypothetical protein
MSKKILIVGDIHYGSKFAPKFGGKVTPIQNELSVAWTEMVDEVGRVDVVVANGDLCEGADPKSNGLGCWTTDLNEQARGAARMLEMIDCESATATFRRSIPPP